MQNKQYEKALKFFNAYINLTPFISQYTHAYVNRGLCYHELKDYQKAIKDYQAAIKLEPKDTNAYIYLGNLYYELKDNKSAFFNYQKACDLGNCQSIEWLKHNELDCSDILDNLPNELVSLK
jgi:tetratricopeptide (TPR) repeat protein